MFGNNKKLKDKFQFRITVLEQDVGKLKRNIFIPCEKCHKAILQIESHCVKIRPYFDGHSMIYGSDIFFCKDCVPNYDSYLMYKLGYEWKKQYFYKGVEVNEDGTLFNSEDVKVLCPCKKPKK
jgi:hypothetical protein